VFGVDVCWIAYVEGNGVVGCLVLKVSFLFI
jgi:hypothetical protein